MFAICLKSSLCPRIDKQYRNSYRQLYETGIIYRRVMIGINGTSSMLNVTTLVTLYDYTHPLRTCFMKIFEYVVPDKGTNDYGFDHDSDYEWPNIL